MGKTRIGLFPTNFSILDIFEFDFGPRWIWKSIKFLFVSRFFTCQLFSDFSIISILKHGQLWPFIFRTWVLWSGIWILLYETVGPQLGGHWTISPIPPCIWPEMTFTLSRGFAYMNLENHRILKISEYNNRGSVYEYMIHYLVMVSYFGKNLSLELCWRS